MHGHGVVWCGKGVKNNTLCKRQQLGSG
jgi:hypothetical protein